MLAGVQILFCANAALAAPAFVQDNYAVPQSPQSSVTVPYTGTQRTGDLNVVIVGWNDTTAQISSVTDTTGNVYQLVIGPTQVSGSLSQSIFYAKSIGQASANANAVTVTFSAAATYPDIRVLEYSGVDPLNPVDVFAGATGNSTTSSSGATTTTNAMDLIVAANTVRTATISSGGGFAARVITGPDGDIAEDELVTTTGSYSASANLNYPGNWVMQMVAFRAAGSSASPTQTPNPTPAPPPSTGVPTLIQHVSTGMDQNPISTLTIGLPNPSLAGNLIIVGVQFSTANSASASIASVTDNMGNVYTAGPSVKNNGQVQALYYSTGARPGVTSVKVKFNNLSGANQWSGVQGVVSEFANVAVSSPVDGTSISSNSSLAPGSISTSANNSLVYEWGIDSDSFNTNGTGNGPAYNGSQISSGPGFTLLSADLRAGSGDQFMVQTTPGSVSPSFSASGTDTWESIAIAFKAAAAGTLPDPNAMRIVHEYHSLVGDLAGGGNAPSIPLQFPSTGNLLVGVFNAPGAFVTNVTDGNNNTWSCPSSAQAGSNQQIFYAANASTGPKLSNIDLHMSTYQAILVLYDVVNAAADPFDTATAFTGYQGSVGNLTGSTITPSTSNGLVFSGIGISDGTLNGLATPGAISDIDWNDLEHDNTTPNNTINSTLDEDNGYGHVYNSTTSPITFTWTFTANSIAAQSFQSAAIAFKAAAASPTPTPTPTPAPSH
jgi:hypothetical protein